MSRPWYASYALFPDRAEPAFIVSGFTPPEGTTPEQAARLRWFSHDPAPSHTVLYADERAALYQAPQHYWDSREAPRLTQVVVRYDDLPGTEYNGGLLGVSAETRAFVRSWAEQALATLAKGA